MTNFSNICIILGTLFENYKGDPKFADFIDFNDIGLPLAYFQREGLAEVSDDGNKYILESWEIFVASLGLEDTGFSSLDQMFEIADNKNK